MRRWLLAGLLCLTSLHPSVAQEFPVTFHTDPAETTVFAPGVEQSAARPVQLRFVKGLAKVTFHCEGYLDASSLIDINDVHDGAYKSEIVLQPKHFWVPYTRWPGALLPALALLGGVAGLAALSRNRKTKLREITLSKFEERRDQHDSLAMQTVGNYMLVEALGSGGMATVYRGLPVDTLEESQAVAVKVLGREVMAEEDFRERFRREVNAYRKLSHPHIITLYDWGEMPSGMIYIVLELVDGKTVRDQMPLSAPHVYKVLDSLSSALQYAHDRGIIHRDLKPENLMITRAGQLKVMDFGLARHEGAERLTRTDTILGTPAYMAPEQLSRAEPDHRLDQYAVGVILYELLCGKLPYSSDSVMGLFSEILGQAPIPIRERNPQISPEIETALNKMLAKDPQDRFPSVAAAWAVLSPLLCS